MLRSALLPTSMPPLGGLIHGKSVGQPVRIHRLLDDAQVAAHLDSIDERLVAAGLVQTRARRRAQYLACLPWLALLGYGLTAMIVGSVFGTASAVPYVVAIVVTMLVARSMFDRNPANRLGRETLATLSQQHKPLKTPTSAINRTHTVAGTAALVCAVYGEKAYWRWEPEVARALGIPKPNPSTSSDEGDGDGGDGGGSGE